MNSRASILNSIRSHLAASPPQDPIQSVFPSSPPPDTTPVLELFKQNVEAVDGHCIVVQNAEELTRILKNFEGRIAVSDAPILTGLAADVPSDIFQ